jgi:hypothetical protein
MRTVWMSVLAVAIGTLVGGAALGATLLEVDLDSLPGGTVTKAALDGVTSGGTWSLSADANYDFSIADDGGDKAFEADYANIGAVLNTAFEITLDSEIDISELASDLTIAFRTHPEATTSFHRYVKWEFMDSDGTTVLFYLYAYDNGSFRLNNSQFVSVNEWQGNNNFTWDEDHTRVAGVSITIDSSGSVSLTVSVSGETLTPSTSFNVANAELGSIRVQTKPGSPYGQGAFMSDILITGPGGTLELLLDGGDADSVDENESVDTVVGTLSVANPAGSGPFVYELFDTGTYPDNSSFTIDGNELKTAEEFDYETKSSYSIRVRETSESVDKVFPITVNNVTEPFGGPVATAEATKDQTLVGTLESVLGDKTSVAYAIETAADIAFDGNKFEMTGASSDTLEFKDSGDATEGAEYYLTVSATFNPGSVKRYMLIKVTVVSAASHGSGTIFVFR